MESKNLLSQIAEVSAKYSSFNKLGAKSEITVFQHKKDKSITFKTLEEAIEKGLDFNLNDVEKVSITTSPVEELLGMIGVEATTKEDVAAAKAFSEMVQHLTKDSMFKRANNAKNAELNEAKTSGKSPKEIEKIRLERVQLYIKFGKKPTRLGEDDMAMYKAELAKIKK